MTLGVKASLPPGSFDPVEAFEDFFMFKQDVPNVCKYRQAIHDLWSGNKSQWTDGATDLVFAYEDLLDYDPKLASELFENPEKTLEDAVIALKNILRIDAGGIIDENVEYFVRVTAHERTMLVELRRIYKEYIDKFVRVKGMVIRASDVRPQVIEALFECQDCGHQFGVEQYDTVLLKPAKCLNPGCNNKNKFILVSKDSKFVDWQSLYIQEAADELKAGSIPRSIHCILTHNLVDRVRPGDRINVIGVWRAVPQENNRGAKSTIFKTFLQANNIELRDGTGTDEELTEEDIKLILEAAKQPGIQKKLARSIGRSILGWEHIKLACMLFLMGGVTKFKKNGKRVRGDPHIFLIGNPSVGKTEIMQSAIRCSPHGLYTTGKGSSAAGLTAAVVKDQESGGRTLEAGVVVLCDTGHCAIDEFDKMRVEDRGVMHECLDQQTCSIAKFGIVATLNARTGIIAAANPKLGRWNPWKTAEENIHLPPPILSRFDLIFVMTNKVDPEKDDEIMDYIYDEECDIDALPAAESTDLKPVDYFEEAFVKKYVTYARKYCHPKLPPKKSIVHKKIKEFFARMRSAPGEEVEGGVVGIDWRNFRGIIRLITAHAKGGLKEYIEESDVDPVLELVTRCLKDVGTDPETDTFDIDRIMTGVSHSQVGYMTKMQEILKDMEEENGGKPVEFENFKDRMCGIEGMNENSFDEAIKTLKREGDVIFPRPTLIKSSKNTGKF